jgi:hypothetical protein
LLQDSYETDGPLDSYNWFACLEFLPPSDVPLKCQLLTEVLVSPMRLRVDMEQQALSDLIQLAGKYPGEVMNAIGKAATDPTRNFAFFFSEFRGLFEAIGFETVTAWIRNVGVDAARAVARHLPSPSPTEADPTHVPELTSWVLNEYGQDDRVAREFLIGRHAMELRVGGPQHPESVRQVCGPYLAHPLRRIREWAQYEIEHAQAEWEFWEREEQDFERA